MKPDRQDILLGLGRYTVHAFTSKLLPKDIQSNLALVNPTQKVSER